MTQGPVLTPKGLRAARMFLEKLYRQEGYVFIRVGSPDVRPMGNESRAQVVFHLQRDPRCALAPLACAHPHRLPSILFCRKRK